MQDQSIIDMAYSNELVFAASSRKGGDNSRDMGDSAVIVAYDYLNREKLAVVDPRDYIPGLASPVVYVYGLTADPNSEENGRIWQWFPILCSASPSIETLRNSIFR